ncbi:catalase family peroxidase [Pseudomonas chlororaphis]|uniref:Catalase-related peroxidase n=1 Tax=Pseudomonas chlororaphis TaxID=587753 RepID=A0A1Q8ER61_9PSED|nr:catalase family peroxidase [Pseudomonas chlororaphis]OLF54276.1 catalase [Pseudomonas chlororaphis]
MGQPGRLVAALLLGALNMPLATAQAEDNPTTARSSAMGQEALYNALLDALYATFGQHAGFRVAHAKGILVQGTFVATRSAPQVSRALHFQGGVIPVRVRFSNFSGLPGTRDGDPTASPHGLAIRFSLPDGQSTDIVAHSFNGFPVATAQDFLGFLQGIAASVATPPDPAPLAGFLAGHPRARQFLDAPKPAPRSYISTEYFGVNALEFSNLDGERRMGRYRIEPLIDEPALSDEQAAAMPDDYLQDELATRLGKGPAKIRLVLQLAAPGDGVEDGSIPWSRTNQEVELGILTLDRLIPPAAQQAEQQRLDFNPGRLPDGIAPSADPMIEARQGIYERAMDRRRQP